MFKTIYLENSDGDRLDFSLAGPFTISDIQGLDPPAATINTSEVALQDGARFNSSKLNPRTINLAFAIQGDAARSRVKVFKVLKSKQYIKLVYQGQERDVYIDGYIEDINISYFAKKQIVTVVIVCPDPYFKAAAEHSDTLSAIYSDFHFPFQSEATPEIIFGHIVTTSGVTITNDGDVACGLIIELSAKGNVTNPAVYDYITAERFGITYALKAGDLVTIDTRQGHKGATLLRGGVTTNIFTYIDQGSTWLQLAPNGSTFVYTVDTGAVTDLTVTFRHIDLYEGV